MSSGISELMNEEIKISVDQGKLSNLKLKVRKRAKINLKNQLSKFFF